MCVCVCEDRLFSLTPGLEVGDLVAASHGLQDVSEAGAELSGGVANEGATNEVREVSLAMRPTRDSEEYDLEGHSYLRTTRAMENCILTKSGCLGKLKECRLVVVEWISWRCG